MEISGGADSMLAALMAIEKYGPECEYHGLLVNYNQLPFLIEQQKAEIFCERYNIKLHVVKISDLFTTGAVVGEQNVGEVSDVYTPLRNFVIGAIAASLAERLGASVIVSGSKTLNLDGTPWSFTDSTLGFYLHMDSMLNYLTHGKIKTDPILMQGRNTKMTKFEVYDGLEHYGLEIDDMWNCFNSATEKCGYCNNCKTLNDYINARS
jgi:7-cyano-7-deazaguanine synthase in queuosine biosynthesis